MIPLRQKKKNMRGTMRTFAVLSALVVAAAASFGSLAIASGHSRTAGTGTTVRPYTIVYSRGSTDLGSFTFGPNAGVDVSWKKGVCSHGYESPPVAVTWAGSDVPQTAAPVLAPCVKSAKKAAVRNIPVCKFHLGFWIGDYEVWYDSATDSYSTKWTGSSAAAKNSCPIGTGPAADNANLFLYKGSFTSAVEVSVQGAVMKKLTLPAGTNAVHWYGSQGG